MRKIEKKVSPDISLAILQFTPKGSYYDTYQEQLREIESHSMQLQVMLRWPRYVCAPFFLSFK
jgi:hypothetical protein